jgi:hypothetical protein
VFTGSSVGVGVGLGVAVFVGVGVGVLVGKPTIDLVISYEHDSPVDFILILVVPFGTSLDVITLPVAVTPVTNGVPEHVDPVHEYKSKGPGVPTIEFNVMVIGIGILY